ncbi:uncharacterized protein LOC103279771 isoform X1 [Anolis carolinensis]|uniref:uncharacterized protein LOC103279771 isoform X1 n=1 Tax=Anolis carolinensis TaxID=28377 RepID=UPI000462B9DB|nr:PREDICTED: uncharacterized protein LOC103279771 isoform X2 [Anolis carolinensis]|eukprot:XP_008114658.1 PREDICTED: uncharacterized protein LOC103279771 isoform X2 [Anolis carolinensis]
MVIHQRHEESTEEKIHLERKTIRHWPSFTFFWVVVLLSLENGAFEAIDTRHLKTIIDYIRWYGLEDRYQYAVAVRLDKKYCSNPNPTNLEAVLPDNEMLQMKNAIKEKNGIYIPNKIKNIIAARPDKELPRKHAEWRLLNGGKNSPVEKLLANGGQNSCFIFFSKSSPCVDRCLNMNDMNNIVQILNPIFNRYSENSRAFVFETIYYKDEEKRAEVVINAWKKIRHAPLFKCNRNNCIQCFDNNLPEIRSPCYSR